MDEEKIQEEVVPKKKFSWKRIGKIVGIITLTAGLIGAAYVGVQSRTFKITYASLVLDNREHFLDCYSLPFYVQVEKAVKEHADVVEKIKELGAFEASAHKIICKGWEGGIELTKGDIVIEYDTHEQRKAIENLIGNNFFGIPWRGENH